MLNKRVCVLSMAGINDSRAQRTIRAMSKEVFVDYFFLDSSDDIDDSIFNKNVSLYPITRSNTNSIFSKIINHTFFFFDSSFLIKEVLKISNKYEIIYAHDLITSYAASKLAKINNSKIIYDVHDLYIETLNQFFPKKTSIVKNIFVKISMNIMKLSGVFWEKHFIQKVDLTVTVNDYLKNYLINKYNIHNCIVTPNFPEYRVVKKSEELRKVLNIDDKKKIILYHGTLNNGRYLELIVKSAKYFENDKILVVIGEGPLKKHLKQLASNTDFDNKVKFLDFVDYNKLLEFITSAYLGIMLLEHINASKKHASPNKVTEYMAAGIPILVSDSPECRKMIEQANCGFIQSFETPEMLAEFINKISESDNIIQLGENGQKAFHDTFNWNKFEPIFTKKIRELLD